MPQAKTAPRRTVPKELAVIDADQCTGCGACIEICPADCIVTVDPHSETPGLGSWCEVDWDRCVGCRLCVRIPTKKTDRYRLLLCPWEAIEMVPPEALVDRVHRMGGPPEYADANRQRLLDAARRQLGQTE